MRYDMTLAGPTLPLRRYAALACCLLLGAAAPIAPAQAQSDAKAPPDARIVYISNLPEIAAPGPGLAEAAGLVASLRQETADLHLLHRRVPHQNLPLGRPMTSTASAWSNPPSMRKRTRVYLASLRMGASPTTFSGCGSVNVGG